MKIPVVPCHVDQCHREHPGEEIPTGTTSPSWPAGPSSKRGDYIIYYQYKADRTRRTLRALYRDPSAGRVEALDPIGTVELG